MSIGIVTCTNGLGHINRQARVSRRLIALGEEVVLYAPAHMVARVAPDLHGITCDFDTRTTIDDWRSGRAVEWVNRIPSLQRHRLVVSDNLLDVLHLVPDAIISASFFWHKAVEVMPEVYEAQEKLLREARPKVVSNKYFCADYVKSQPDSSYIGFICDEFSETLAPKNIAKRRTLLVQAGFSASPTKARIQRVFHKPRPYIEELFKDFEKVFVERDILSGSKIENGSKFEAADFSSCMFDGIDVIIGRGGLGIITTAVERGIPILALREPENGELQENTKNLETHFGYPSFNEFETAVRSAVEIEPTETKVDTLGFDQFLSILAQHTPRSH